MSSDEDDRESDKGGNTNLHLRIIEFDDAECLEKLSYLKPEDINIYAENKDGCTPLKLAVDKNMFQTIGYLIKTTLTKDDNDLIHEGYLLHIAAQENFYETIAVLLKYRWHPDESDYDGITPLLIAAALDHYESFVILYDSGATTWPTSNYGYNVFHAAVKSNSLRIIEYINQKDETDVSFLCKPKSETPLHIVAMTGNAKIFKRIVKYFQKNVNVLNETGETPLKVAIKNNSTDIVELLIQHGATATVTIADRKSLYFCVAQQKNVETLKVLCDDLKSQSLEQHEFYEILQYGFIQAIEEGFVEGVEYFLNRHDWKGIIRFRPNITESTSEERSPMQLLIEKMPQMATKVFDQCFTFYPVETTKTPEGVIDINYEFIDDTYFTEFRDNSHLGKLVNEMKRDTYLSKEAKKVLGPPPNDVLTNLLKQQDIIHADDLMCVYKRDTLELQRNAKSRKTNYNKIIADHPLTLMLKHNRRGLLSHKLVQSYINYKWNSYVKIPFYLLCLYHFIFVAFLSYVVLSSPSNMIILSTNNSSSSKEFLSDQCLISPIPKWLIFIFGCVHFFFNGYKMWCCFETFESLFDLLILCLMAGALFCNAHEMNILLILYFCSWITFINTVKKVPRLGVYILMIVHTLKLHLRFIPVISLFLVPFIICYFVLLTNERNLFSFFKTSVRTITMMVGELDYETTINLKAANNFLLYFIFCLFLMIFTIFWMNILIGLAVADMTVNLEKAEFLRTNIQIETIRFIEALMKESWRRHFWRGCCRFSPTIEKNRAISRLQSLFRWLGSSKKEMNKLSKNFNRPSCAETLLHGCNSIEMAQINFKKMEEEKCEKTAKTFAQSKNFQNHTRIRRYNTSDSEDEL